MNDSVQRVMFTIICATIAAATSLTIGLVIRFDRVDRQLDRIEHQQTTTSVP